MIRLFVEAQLKEWDEAISFLSFPVRDAPTESLGLFEFIFGGEVRGPLHLFKERVIELLHQEILCKTFLSVEPDCSQSVRLQGRTCLGPRMG